EARKAHQYAPSRRNRRRRSRKNGRFWGAKVADTRLLQGEMNIWDELLARIETKMNRHSFYTWFRPTSFLAEDRSSVTVRVPNATFKEWLTKHYSAVIGEAAAELRRSNLVIHFVADSSSDASSIPLSADEAAAFEAGVPLSQQGPAGLNPR